MKVSVVHFSLFTLLTSLLLFPSSAHALGPQEVAILVNADSEASRSVAKAYVKLRKIPYSNLIPLHFPPLENPNSLTPDQFTDYIWNPANKIIKQRGLDDHILAWVYSVDTPIRVLTDPPISIHGATFFRNDFSALTQVTNGTYLSPLFAGPSRPGDRSYNSQTLNVLRDTLGGDMPLTAMSLGYVGTRGNSMGDVTKTLQSGFESDGTRPTGTVYFITSSDIRSTCRSWQFESVQKELARLGVGAVVSDQFPPAGTAIGVMMGEAVVQTDQAHFLPGAMAEHLTSAAAIFESPDQTKLTAWLDAGAVASAGTVTEPLSMWMKFPHARFFVHYASGCTILESFYQSVRSPAQLFMVGDPLAQPWKPVASVRVAGMEKRVKGTVEWQVSVEGTGLYRLVEYYLDGRRIGKGAAFTFDSTVYTNGQHQVHVVAYKTGAMRNQAMAVFNIDIQNP